jgi:hypothetical protein
MGQFAQAVSEIVEEVQHCKFGTIVKDFDDDDEAELLRLIEGGKYGVIRKLLPSHVAQKTVADHVRARCKCPTDAVARGVVTRG